MKESTKISSALLGAAAIIGCTTASASPMRPLKRSTMPLVWGRRGGVRKHELALAAAFALTSIGAAQAGPIDGSEDFSLKPDQTATGVPNNGQILYSHENGTYGNDFVIPMKAPNGTSDSTAQVDALSSHHRHNPWAHNLLGITPPDRPLQRIIAGTFGMTFSVTGDSNIFEWKVSGPEPVPNGPGRTLNQDGHFPATMPNPIGWPSAHDSATDLGLENKDLDALEHHDHFLPYPDDPGPFPGAPYNWENGDDNVYFSVQDASVMDNGDIYVYKPSLAANALYLDDALFAPVFGLGFDPALEELEDLILFDLVGLRDEFNAGTNGKWDSDMFLFTLKPGAYDPIGDNVYWVSAAIDPNTGTYTGGLYADPQLQVNVDALDAHVPEPGSLFLLSAGLIGMGLGRRWLGRGA